MIFGDYTIIRTGLPLSRKQAKPETATDVYTALTLKAVADNGEINMDFTEPYYAIESLKPEYFTHIGDIVIRLSAPYTAIVVTEHTENLLASQHFAIIRCNENYIDTQFLGWWLTRNQKLFYKSASGGAYMGTISSGYIAGLPFVPPPLEIQCKIGNLLEMTKREQELLAQLSKAKARLINAVINDTIKNGGIAL